MSRAHLYRTVQALGGSLVSGASVTVCEPGTTTPIAQVLHDSEAGAGTLSNPFLATGGIIDFYLDNAQDTCSCCLPEQLPARTLVVFGAEQPRTFYPAVASLPEPPRLSC